MVIWEQFVVHDRLGKDYPRVACERSAVAQPGHQNLHRSKARAYQQSAIGDHWLLMYSHVALRGRVGQGENKRWCHLSVRGNGPRRGRGHMKSRTGV